MNQAANSRIFSRGTRDLLGRVRDAVRSAMPDAEVVLYGSRARGEASALSDWDLLLLTDQEPHSPQVGAARANLYDIELDANVVLSVIVRNREAWRLAGERHLPFHAIVDAEGVAL